MAQLFGLARIGRDAELRFTHDGTPVLGVALAFNYGKKGDDGKRPTQWVEGSLWRQRAEALAPHLLKGKSVSVTIDDIHIETYQRSDGGSGAKLVGTISAIEFAGSSQPSDSGHQTAQRPAQTQRPSAPAARPPQNLADLDDDIPF